MNEYFSNQQGHSRCVKFRKMKMSCCTKDTHLATLSNNCTQNRDCMLEITGGKGKKCSVCSNSLEYP